MHCVCEGDRARESEDRIALCVCVGDRACESEGPTCVVCVCMYVRVTVLVRPTGIVCVCMRVRVTVLVSLRDLLVNGGIVERVVYVSGENAPSRETVHYTAPEENATATHLCVVCVGCVWGVVCGTWCVCGV